MGFLQLAAPDAPADTSAGILISFWFRVPSATLSSVHAAYQVLLDAYNDDETSCVLPPPANSGIVPLITFGKRQVEAHGYNFCGHTQSEYTSVDTVGVTNTDSYQWNCATCVFDLTGSGSSNVTTVFWDDPTFIGNYADNSFLGVNCRGSAAVFDFSFQYDWADGPPTIAGTPQMTAWATDPDPISSWHMAGAGCPLPPFCEPTGTFTVFGTKFAGEQSTVTYLQTFSDKTYAVDAEQPEAFAGSPGSDGSDGSYGTTVSSNRWHHVIFSLLPNPVSTQGTQTAEYATSGATVSAAATVHLSFDDSNKTGQQISLCCPDDFGAGPNDLITILGREFMLAWTESNGTSAYGSVTGSGTVERITKSGINRPAYGFTPPAFDLKMIAIPGDADTVYQVEMAELQVYTGVTLDTSVTENRRAFVTSTGRPETDYTIADALLGKSPDIRLHGRTRWQAGTNLGSAGNLSPTGTIDPFTPGPSLS